MRTSEARILTTHVGSLPRPAALADLLHRQERGEAVDAVGERSRMIASTDCGFGTYVGWNQVAESVVWAKQRTLAEGVALASTRFWG